MSSLGQWTVYGRNGGQEGRETRILLIDRDGIWEFVGAEIADGVKELVRREEMQVRDCGFDSQWARFGGKIGVGEDVRVVGGSLARERRWRRELGRRNGMERESG